MRIALHRLRHVVTFAVLVAPAVTQVAAADDSAGAARPRATSRVSALKPISPELPASTAAESSGAAHPLAAILDFARKERDYMASNVRDFTCRLVKRERIDGFLQDYQFIDMRVREALHDQTPQVPLSIHLSFLGPSRVAGRQVLFVEGQNDGK